MERKGKCNNDIVSLDCNNKGYSGLKQLVLNDRYKFVKELSRGSFGRVFKIEDVKEKRFLAIKI